MNWRKRSQDDDLDTRPSITEVIARTERALDRARDDINGPGDAIVRLRPVGQRGDRVIDSKNPLPHPDAGASHVWKAAWFIRAMRTEDMQDAAKDMFKLLPPEGLKSADDVQNWLLKWARKEHGVADEAKTTLVG